MKLLLMAFAMLIATTAAAEEFELGQYKRVRLSDEGATSITVFLKKTFETYDGCNYFGTSGDVYSLSLPEGESRLYQPLVFDLGVVQTELGCPDLPEPRTVTVNFDKTFAAGEFGGVYLDILYPAEFEMSWTAAD